MRASKMCLRVTGADCLFLFVFTALPLSHRPIPTPFPSSTPLRGVERGNGCGVGRGEKRGIKREGFILVSCSFPLLLSETFRCSAFELSRWGKSAGWFLGFGVIGFGREWGCVAPKNPRVGVVDAELGDGVPVVV